jgi:hypothetical protein
MWRAPTTSVLLKFWIAVANRFCPAGTSEKVYEGEGDCTSETGAGQFSIFGAIEEKSRKVFSERARMKRQLRRGRLCAGSREFLGKGRGHGKIWSSGAAEYPQKAHRKCRKSIAGF